MMVRLSTATFLAALVLVPAIPAADKKAPDKPVGTWSRKLPNDVVITLALEAEKFRVDVTTDSGASIKLAGSYGVAEDGTLFGIISTVDKKGLDAGPDKGELFSFRFKLDKGTLTISDYKASTDRPEVKELIEGEFKKK
jgi:hypothetical protein